MKAALTINVRRPFASEMAWFRREPNTAGYAADDGQIVLNPYSTLSNLERACVVRNEAIRLFMRLLDISPSVDLHPDQIKAFLNTPYESNHDALRETIIARIASGDPSAGQPTERQIGFASALAAVFDRVVTLTSDEESDRHLLCLAADVGRCSRTEATF